MYILLYKTIPHNYQNFQLLFSPTACLLTRIPTANLPRGEVKCKVQRREQTYLQTFREGRWTSWCTHPWRVMLCQEFRQSWQDRAWTSPTSGDPFQLSLHSDLKSRLEQTKLVTYMCSELEVHCSLNTFLGTCSYRRGFEIIDNLILWSQVKVVCLFLIQLFNTHKFQTLYSLPMFFTLLDSCAYIVLMLLFYWFQFNWILESVPYLPLLLPPLLVSSPSLIILLFLLSLGSSISCHSHVLHTLSPSPPPSSSNPYPCCSSLIHRVLLWWEFLDQPR